MTSLSTLKRGMIRACLPVLLALLLICGGCTQPASQKQQQAPAVVTATQTDNSHIMLTYPGSTVTDTLLALEVTVTDSTGNTQTRSVGDRYSTTPLKWGATLTLTGNFGGNDHMIVTGYFMNSSQKLLLDTTI